MESRWVETNTGGTQVFDRRNEVMFMSITRTGTRTIARWGTGIGKAKHFVFRNETPIEKVKMEMNKEWDIEMEEIKKHERIFTVTEYANAEVFTGQSGYKTKFVCEDVTLGDRGTLLDTWHHVYQADVRAVGATVAIGYYRDWKVGKRESLI